MQYEDKSFYPKNQQAWRHWLEKNHQSVDSIWLIAYKKGSGIPSILHTEAVDEALCFGWIDSTRRQRDENSYYQFYTKRKPKSNWSKVNKAKVSKLLKEGKMTEAGMAIIQQAKANGSWNALDEVEALIVPDDLVKALKATHKAFEHFDAFPKSSKKIILHWVISAKRAETRHKRIEETARLAAKNIRAHQ